MESNIQIFNNEDFGEVRVTEVDGEPWFVAKDIAMILGYSNTKDAVNKHVEDEDQRLVQLTDIQQGSETLPPNQKASKIKIINESGLYALIFGSKMTRAKQFKTWVTKEVLPSIRKTGSYSLPKPEYSDTEILAKAVLISQQKLKECHTLIEAQSKKIEEDRPKVDFANAIIGSKTSCLIGELAKILTQNGFTIGQNRLFKLLRRKGYLGHSPKMYNIPYQQYVERGYFELKKGIRTGLDGSLITTTTTKVTPEGQLYFVNLFLHDRDITEGTTEDE